MPSFCVAINAGVIPNIEMYTTRLLNFVHPVYLETKIIYKAMIGSSQNFALPFCP